MLKKVTTVMSTHKSKFVRKAAVIGGVTLGIGIGLLLNKVDEDEFIIGEVVTDADDPDYSVRGIDELSQDEIDRADRSIAGEE